MVRKCLLNFPLSLDNYSVYIDYIISLAHQKKSAMICVANVHMFIEGYKDHNFLKIVNNADIVTPDGLPLLWALQLLYGIKQERVAGMDLLPDLINKLALQNVSVFFYGSSENILNKTKKHLENRFPKLRLAGFHSPPFGEINYKKDDEIVDRINNSSPCVVFVVLGCPKQEKWMASMRNKINTVMIGIGGALPVMLGIQKRAPKWMQNKGLEWLYRLAIEPRRLFKRYMITNSLFLWIFLREYVKVKILKGFNFLKRH